MMWLELGWVVPHFEFFEGAANQRRKHTKANIPASIPREPKGAGFGLEPGSFMSPTMALASSPQTHTAIVRARVIAPVERMG
jgi:hypothetical protein